MRAVISQYFWISISNLHKGKLSKPFPRSTGTSKHLPLALNGWYTVKRFLNGNLLENQNDSANERKERANS